MYDYITEDGIITCYYISDLGMTFAGSAKIASYSSEEAAKEAAKEAVESFSALWNNGNQIME
ncbi:TPA: hypothetical protein MYJ36_003653 [Klebsiella quasipneumoniae]|nr:hypothetical protein [Klebsiella quasipneumoniae]